MSKATLDNGIFGERRNIAITEKAVIATLLYI